MPLSIGKSGSSKISTKNAFSTQDLGTVDSNHKEKMEYFQQRRESLDQLKTDLHVAEKDLVILKNSSSVEKLKDLYDLQKHIVTLKSSISDIENNKEEMQYLLNTGSLLFQYYDYMNTPATDLRNNNTSTTSTNTSKTKNAISNSSINNKKSLNLNDSTNDFIDSEYDTKDSKDLRDSKLKMYEDIVKKPKRFQNSKPKTTTIQLSRREMLDEYKSLTDPNWVKKSESKFKKEESICESCQIPKILQYKESKYICPICGIEEITFIDSDRPSFKDPPPDANYFAYKRINHFNELLAQFQAKESTHIPKDVFDMIRKEAKKERKEVKELDYEIVKGYLKKHADKKYNQYYDHIFHIINRLNGDKPLNMTPEMESNLRYLFLQIQEPFDKYCPSDRKNFISYNFVFYKFCQMLGYKEFLKYFPLLKSKDKLYEQEKIWQKIMIDIGLSD
jgi:predicted RNA-binding Zn-ribbon protein involved in translation (DUF1610 family)